jgi:hypothetical protein
MGIDQSELDREFDADRATPLEKARWCYRLLVAGLGTPPDHAKYIRKQLSPAGEPISQLDETGRKSAEELSEELRRAEASANTPPARGL